VPACGLLILAAVCLQSSGHIDWTQPVAQPEATKTSSGQLGKTTGRELAGHLQSRSLPLYFEANEGQVATEVELLSRSKAHTLFLTHDAAVLSLRDSWVRMRFVGANQEPEVSGLEPLPRKTHYLIGNDRAKWRTHIPHYASARYGALYPGIDLAFYGNEGQFEYDFVVSPGADPSAIHIAFEGAEDLSLDESGNLVLTPAARNGIVAEAGGGGGVPESERGAPSGAPAHLTLQAPVVYQEVGGKRQPIAGSYVLLDESEVGFQVEDYDRTKVLVIDPVLTFSTYVGGEDDEMAGGIAVDGDGNAYIVGTTKSISYPMALASAPRARASLDIFVSKMNVDSATLIYTLFIGTNDEDRGIDVAVDAQGHAYITGGTYSNIFPTVNPVQPTWGGDADAFVSKLSLDGSALLYSTYLGGTDQDAGTGIALDAAGSAYVIGTANSSNFPTAHALQPDRDGTNDAFIAKLSSAGSTLTISTYLGGSETEFGAGIDVDEYGNVYVTGSTYSTDFPTANPFSSILVYGFEKAFVTKLNAAGSALVYSTYLGGSFFDKGSDIAVDGAGSAWVVGRTSSTDFPMVKPSQATLAGTKDAFVTAFSAAGQGLYSTYLDGDVSDEGQGIALDRQGNVYLTGHTNSSTFPTVRPYDGSANGMWDVFLAKLVMPLDFWVASAGPQDTAPAMAVQHLGEGPSLQK